MFPKHRYSFKASIRFFLPSSSIVCSLEISGITDSSVTFTFAELLSLTSSISHETSPARVKPLFPPSQLHSWSQSSIKQTSHAQFVAKDNIARHVADVVSHRATKQESCLKSLQKVGACSTFRNGFCNLSRNVFGRYKVCYIGQCFVQLVLQLRCKTSCTKNSTV